MTGMIRPHFAAPTVRSVFSPERSLPPSSLNSRKIFPPEGLGLPQEFYDESIPTGNNSTGNTLILIKKPSGLLNRSDGYNLKSYCTDEMHWGVAQFTSIKVNSVSFRACWQWLTSSHLQAFMDTLVDAYLDGDLSRTTQNPEQLRLLYEEVCLIIVQHFAHPLNGNCSGDDQVPYSKAVRQC